MHFINTCCSGVSPDMQTPRRGKYIFGPSGNGGPADNANDGQGTAEDLEQTEEQLSKLLEEKMTNNGTGDAGIITVLNQVVT